ncbi:MAG: hypothetical protein KF773_22085 [Deltaproteobacteria bacterium]|nr:hypothetical protein [Deltaproteobacteria bacterium]
MLRRTALSFLLLTGTAAASQEQIHRWKTATIVAPTSLFGDVEVKAGADASGNVTSLAVTAQGTTITVPATWLATLPKVPLASLEVRTERGYDPQPILYVVFRTGPTTVKGSIDLHVWFQGGKLTGASLNTYDGAGNSKFEQRKAP